MTTKRIHAVVLIGLLCLMTVVAAALPQGMTAIVSASAQSGSNGTNATPSKPRRGSADNPYFVSFPPHSDASITYMQHIYNCMIAYAGTTGYPPREGTQYFKDSNTGASFISVWTDYGGVTILQL